MNHMINSPYADLEKGVYVIKLEQNGHKILVNHQRDGWYLKILDTQGSKDNETAWATIKKAEGLRNSPNAKRIRESIGQIVGLGNTSKTIDCVIDILQTQGHLWPIGELEEENDVVGKDETQAQKLVNLVLESDIELFRDQCDDEYIIINLQDFLSDASVAVLQPSILRDHTYTPPSSVSQSIQESEKTPTLPTLATPLKRHYRLKSNKIRDILSLMMFKKTGEVPGGDALKSAVTLLSGYTINKPRIKLYNRLGVQDDGSWWLDLSNESSEAIKINDDKWSLVENPPTIFKRYSHQLPLKKPVVGGSVLDILGFTNFIGLDEQLLYLVFGVLETLIPEIPHVVPYVYGDKGTVKSTSLIAVKAVFDNSVMVKGLLNMHRDSNKLGQVLDHHYLSYFDNISHIDDDQSDLLCRAVTGAGISNRLLYSDDDDFIRQFMRCVAINGINMVARKPDLLDRIVLLKTRKVTRSERKEDQVIMGMIYDKAPFILYDTLDLIVKARKTMKIGVNVDGGLSRMADAMKWGVALTEALGIDRDKFLVAYRNNILEQEENSVKSSVVGDLLVKLLDQRLPLWKNSVSGWVQPSVTEVKFNPSELFLKMRELADEARINTRTDFPSDSTRLSGEINEFAPSLPSCGFRLIRKRSGDDGRKLIFTRLVPTKLDDVMEVQHTENDWLECKDLREYIDKTTDKTIQPESKEEIKPNIVMEVKDIKQKPSLMEGMKIILDMFTPSIDILKSEDVFTRLQEEGFIVTESTGIIAQCVRDSLIFSPRLGWYKKCL